jgi:Bacteriophage holin family
MTIMSFLATNAFAFVKERLLWGLTIFFTAIAKFLLPVQSFIFIAFLVVVADVVSGGAAAWKRGDSFDGKKIVAMLLKALIYNFTIVSMYYTVQTMQFPIDLTYFFTALVAANEIMSNLRNISEFTGIDYYQKVKDKFDFLTPFLAIQKQEKVKNEQEK